MTQKEIYMEAAVIGNGAVDAENLRPVNDNTGHTLLRPAGMPGKTTLPDGWKAWARIGDKLIVTSGRQVGTVDINSDGAPVVSSVQLPGEARCALNKDDLAIVITTGGAVTVRADGSVSETIKDYPAISLLAVADANISASVGDRTLSQAYTNGLFEKKDKEALVGDLADAYRHICSEAASSGVMVQPALARYKLVDSSGSILFESAPVLLTHADGAQCTDTVALTSSDRRTVDGYTLSAKSWHLEAVLPAAETDVAAAEIFMTPLFHPFDADGEGTATVMRASTAGAPFCRVGLPGRENGLGSIYRDKSQRTIMQAIARIEMLEERVAVIRDPFGSAAKIKIDIAVDADPMTATGKIRKAMSKSVAVGGRRNLMLSAPHGFSAACVAEASGAVAWADLRVLPYSGYPVGMFAAEVSGSSWSCDSAVYFKGNTGVSRQESGTTNAPTKLGPVICYPLAEARKMAILIRSGGQKRLAELDLAADASGRYAVYIAQDLRPFTPAVSTLNAPEAVTGYSVDLPDCVAFAASSRPFDIRSVLSVGSGIVTVQGHVSGNQAWDFGRSHFTIGCRGGVFRAGVNLNNGVTGLRTVAERGIDRCDALATSDDGDIFLASGRIIHIDRNGHCKIFSKDQGYVAVARDSTRGELWALRHDGSIDIYIDTKKPVYFRFSHITADTLKMLGNVFAIKGNELYDTATEIFAARNRIRLHLHSNIRPDYLMTGVARLHAAMQASDFVGSISVEGSSLSALRPWAIRKATVSGAVAGPLTMALMCRPARAIDVVIEGDVSEDFVFGNACLKLC